MTRFAIILAFFIGIASTYAADFVDCSGVSKWDPDHTYKKGDRVWRAPDSNYSYLYTCQKDTCKGGGDNQPRYGSSVWKQNGQCRSTPH